MPGPGPTRPFHIVWESDVDLVANIWCFMTQTSPFWNGHTPQEPPKLIKRRDFEQRWQAVLDNSGSYVDDLGRRVAVKRRFDDGSLSEVNDIHWAAHNAAKFWLFMSGLYTRFNVHDEPHSIMWRQQVRQLRSWCREEIRELAVQEMIQLKAQTDTRTTIIPAPNPYPYLTLLRDPSAIRLVVLLPSAERHADIICKLCNSTLSRSDTDKYEALSYVWGDSSRRKSITVNNRQFQATENLESALRNLRYRDTYRVLWIDSMCINQNDVTERNAQVQQMGLIYGSAQRVIVWLGPESEYSSDALDFLRLLPIPDPSGTGSHHYEQNLNKLTSSLTAVHRLLSRPWFRRVWCVQEFILGKNVLFQCGQRSLLPDHFVCLLFVFLDASIIPVVSQAFQDAGARFYHEFFQTLRDVQKLFNWKGGFRREPVLSLLSEFCESASSDPRDIIFGFYGLISDQDPDRDALNPDYTLNTAEVYTKVAVHFLQKHRNLDILSIATRPVRDFLDISRVHWLPSWVPDWRDGQRFGTDVRYQAIAFCGNAGHIGSFDAMYDAPLSLEATPIVLQDDAQVLVLDGINVDTIEVICDVYLGRQQELKVVGEVLSQWKGIADLSKECCYQYTGQPMREAWWRTILMDNTLEVRLGETMSRYRIPPKNGKLEWFPYFPPSAEDDFEAMKKATLHMGPMVGRRFFKTAKGLIGLAPASAQKGDHVVVLFGGKAPFIMRDFGLYHLVGESYVHGIMHGEVIHQPRIEEFRELKVEEFHIG
ncbi:heterokaryon incompatibility protein-domain-containing protein [Biscogniauxia marginata]|nr:heterokaryon incompatibility protein-domain-containing protein [Biscogniauxia marginata]